MNRPIALVGLVVFLAIMGLVILTLLGQALDKSFENDDARIQNHKAQLYISATDQAIIDWREKE